MNEANRLAKTIFGRALAIRVPEEVPLYVEHACGGDVALMAEVWGLLAAHANSGEFLEHPAIVGVDDASRTLKEVPPSIAPMDSPTGMDLPPETNEDYEILEELGHGGMGILYKAWHKPMKRMVALKVIHEKRLDEAGIVERFQQEIRSAGRLPPHPNIVAAFDAPKLGKLQGFAMEYVEGKDLDRVVKEKGPLSVAAACFYIQEAARGLQHMFDHGLVHRDIKPANLLLTRVGKRPRVKVTDLGLAKATRENQVAGEKLTGTGTMMGTPEYSAPEQMENAAGAGVQADIYSAGCTLFFLLTSRPPFQGSLYELMQQHHSMEPTPLNKIRSDVPADLVVVVARMLAKDPTQRFQQPIEVVQALAPFVDSQVMTEPEPPGSGRTDPEVGGRQTLSPGGCKPMIERPKKMRLLRVVIALTALLFLNGIFGFGAAREIRIKTDDGTIVVIAHGLDDKNERNLEFFVRDEKMTVTWKRGKDRKTAEIRQQPGKYKVEVKQAGVKVVGEEVELFAGERSILKARIEPPPESNLDGTKESGQFKKGDRVVVIGIDKTPAYAGPDTPIEFVKFAFVNAGATGVVMERPPRNARCQLLLDGGGEPWVDVANLNKVSK